jgi:hypothetical protein
MTFSSPYEFLFRKEKLRKNVECGLKSVSTGEKERKKDFMLSRVLSKKENEKFINE